MEKMMTLRFITKRMFYVGIIICSVNDLTWGQNINGMRIFVSDEQEVTLVFANTVNRSFSKNEAENLFKIRELNGKLISIRTTQPNFEPTSIIITEGKNSHAFLLEFKKKLEEPAETYYDLSSRKKLLAANRQIKSTNAIKVPVELPPTTNSPSTGTQSVGTPSSGSNNTEPVKEPPPPEADKFPQLVSQANAMYSAGNLPDARLLYEQALHLKPNDSWCAAQLTAIDIKMNADKEKITKTAEEDAYQSRVKSGDQAFQQGNISSAKAHYQLAIQIRPNDAHVANRLNEIELRFKEKEFQEFLKTGREFLTEKKIDSAESYFNKCLSMKPGEPIVLAELQKIKSAREVLKRVHELNERNEMFKMKLSVADSLFNLKLYEHARKLYVEANILKPGNAHVKTQISQIALSKKKEREVATLDSMNRVRYDKEITRGDRAMETKDFKTARTAYNLAKKLQPNESLPLEKMNLIQEMEKMIIEEKKLAQLNKRTADSINKKYNALIIQAHAANKKDDYQTARDLFRQALVLKPGEKTPVLQIETIDSVLDAQAQHSIFTRYYLLGDSTILVGTNFLLTIAYYDSALLIKPNDTYVLRRKANAINKMKEFDIKLMKFPDYEMRTFRFDQALPAFNSAVKARSEGKFSEAYTGFNHFLHAIDTLNVNYYLSTQLPQIRMALIYIKELEQYKPAPPVVVKPEEPKRKRRKKSKKSG